MTGYIIIFVVAALVSTFTTPFVRRFALRLGAVDIPDDRKVHADPTPSMGGIAIYLGLLAGMATAYAMSDFREIFETSSEAIGVLAGASIVLVVGIIDDRFGMKASTKLAGQMVAVGALVLAGVQVFYFWFPKIGIISLSTDLSALLTVLWTVLMINAVNLIDGLDGLAAGVAAIAAAAFFAYAFRASGGEPSTAAVLTAIVAGGCIGFLRHNFNPARIFMGDTGSNLLGLLLASATVSGVGRTTEPQFVDFAGYVVPVLLPLVVLAIPLADAGLAIARRVRGRRPVFHADKRHIHHWLLEMARSHRQAVLVMYLWSATLAAAALALSFGRGPAARWTAFGLIVAFVAAVVVLPRLLRQRLWEPTAVPDPPAQAAVVPETGPADGAARPSI